MASQPKKKQPFRFWPWNPSTTRTTGKASSSKPPSKRPSLPTSTAPSSSPLPQERRQPPSMKLSPVSSPTSQDEDPMPVQLSPEDEQELLPSQRTTPSPKASPSRRATDKVPQQPTPPSRFSPASSSSPAATTDPMPVEISTVQLSPEDEQELPPSQRTTPSPKASPSRRATDKVPQQPTPPSRFSPASSSSPAATTDISPTPSQGVHQPQQPTLTQEVSQTPTTLQTEMHDKKTKEPKSPTHRQEVLTQESQTTRPPKQVEPETVCAPELGHTIETVIPTSRTIPKGTPLTEQESKAVQEKGIAYPDSVANIYTSRVQEKQEMEVEKKEDTETSTHAQANGENVTEEKQQTLEERPKHVNRESTTKDLEVTREISHHSQKTKIANEKIVEKQPDTQGSKMDLEEKQQTTVDPKIPQASTTRGGHDLQTENKDGSKLSQKLNIKHSLKGGSEHGISIITLAGENSGASMHIGRKTLDAARSRRGSKIEEHPSAGSKVNGKALMDTPKMENTEIPSISTSVNSNVQSINNSLIHESSCTQEDPGVHMIFSTKPVKFANSKDEVRPIQSPQSVFQTNPAQSLTNQPNIKKGNA